MDEGQLKSIGMKFLVAEKARLPGHDADIRLRNIRELKATFGVGKRGSDSGKAPRNLDEGPAYRLSGN
jgi:hypothetical protein